MLELKLINLSGFVIMLFGNHKSTQSELALEGKEKLAC